MRSELLARLLLQRIRVSGCALAIPSVLAGLLMMLCPVTAAHAGACGDDVDGARVACACGDIVVSDTILSAADPVASQPCPGDGLLLAPPQDATGLVLDLNGLSLVGTGSGSGLRVLRGGTEGVVVVGGEGDTRASIARFRTGISAFGSKVLREIRNVDLVANDRDGLRVHSSGLAAVSVTAMRNGRDGLRVNGHGSTLTAVEADDNLGSGLRIGGSGATIQARSIGNAGHGAFLTGRGHDLTSSQISGNGGAGVMASGHDHAASSVSIDDNAQGSVAGRRGAVQ